MSRRNFIGIFLLGCLFFVGTKSHADWSSLNLNGYTYYWDGTNSAFPINLANENRWYVQWRYGDSTMVVLYPLDNGTDQYVYLSPQGIYDYTSNGWQRRQTCSLVEG